MILQEHKCGYATNIVSYMNIVVTTYYKTNFGASLQAYALQSFLKNNGHNASLLNYCKKDEELYWSPWTLKGSVSNLLKIIHYKSLNRKLSRFKSFRTDLLDETSEYYSCEDVDANPPNADIFITGSDQVWNLRNCDELYFLPYAKKRNIKTIAYAPSIGEYDLSIEQEEAFRRLIKNIDYISAREKNVVELLAKVSDSKCEIVLDPVFLLTREDWERIISKPLIKGDYIFSYTTSRRAFFEDSLYKICKKENLKSIFLPCESPISRGLIRSKVIWDAGPLEFLNYLYHAKAVCTNSFHATAFSIIFNKSFLAFPHKGTKDNRIMNILNKFGLEDRFSSVDNPKYDVFGTDFTVANSNLLELRKSSVDYLMNAILA